MSLKEKIEKNVALYISGIVISSGVIAFGAGFGLNEIVRVENKNNEIQLLNKEIENLNNEISKKTSTIEAINNEMKPIQNNLADIILENKGLENKLASCNDRIEQWSTALDAWKVAHEKVSSILDSCKTNASILDKVKEIEYKKTITESKLNSAIDNVFEENLVPNYQRQVLEYQARLIELEKKLISQ